MHDDENIYKKSIQDSVKRELLFLTNKLIFLHLWRIINTLEI